MRWIGALLLLPLALAAQTKAEEACAVSGQVLNAATGEPVRRALVTLRRVDISPGTTTIQVTNSATTDATGQFAMAGVAPGKYRLVAEHSGFINTQYGSRGPGKPGILLTFDPGQKSSDMAMRLTPHGVIAGRVLDEEGEPVTGVDVQALRQQYMRGQKQISRVNGVLTNDLGEYRIFGLAPGRYFVGATWRRNSAMPQTDDAYVTTYFPHSADPNAAAPVDLGPGVQLRNIDIALARLHSVTVRGKVTNEVGLPAGADTGRRTTFTVMLSPRNSGLVGGGDSRGATVAADGSFEFPSVTPGSYDITATVVLPGNVLTARAPVQVGGANVEGVSLTIRRGVPVSGRVRMEGETAQSIASVSVVLQPAETGSIVFGPLPTKQVRPDGTFQMDDVPSQRYTVTINGVPEGSYVKSLRSGESDVLAGELEIAGVSPAPLDVRLSPLAGEVTGAVLDSKTQKAVPAMTVVLVPQEKERRNREMYYRTTTTGLSGQFTFKSVIPGEYRVYAWEDAEYGAWMDPDFMKSMQSKGESVSVPEGGRPSVQLTLIPADSQ